MANEAAVQYEKLYKQDGSIQKVINGLGEQMHDCLAPTLDHCITTLIQHGVIDIDVQTFAERYQSFAEPCAEAFNDVYDRYAEVVMDEEEWMAGCVQNKNINFGDVTMKVVEGSVTPSGLTVCISNNTGIDINGGINYDFSIEKKEDDKWSPVKEIGDRTTDTETYIFQGERDLNINWSEIYGSLSAGEYRVVKFFYPSTEDGSYGTDDGFYLFAEFSIE